MRALAPLPAFLLLAASAAACPFGFPGHVHSYVESTAAAGPVPEGKCTGTEKRPAPPAAASAAPYDLRAHPIPKEHREYWEMLDYRFDDDAGRLKGPDGAVVLEAEIEALNRPFDAATQRLNAGLWQSFVLSGYRLDESTCRLIGADAQPLNAFGMKVWAAMSRRQQAHAALETLLAKLRGLDPAAPVPADVREAMLAVAKAGTELPPKLKALLARNETTVGQLRAPASASYAESTKYFDGHRTLADAAGAAIPGGAPGAPARRRGIADPDERALGRTLSAAFNAEMSKTAPGRELLARFDGPGGGLPDVMVLKLTQSPNDPQAPGAVYDSSADRMVINHWEIVKVLRARLPPEKLQKIESRLNDAKQLSKLLAEDPALLPVFTEDVDAMYFHELTHAAQARRNRLDDETLRGNLPGANPLSKEHEAHREHCRYILSKPAEAVERSAWRDYCLDLVRDPAAFKDRVTSMYLSTFSGFSTLPGVAARQEERRRAARGLQAEGGVLNWIEQKLKLYGFGLGDEALAVYGADAERREREFLDALPKLRQDAAGGLLALYESRRDYGRAFELAAGLPGKEASLDVLSVRAVDWIKRDGAPERLNERLSAANRVIARFNERKVPWPDGLREAYDRDALLMGENLLALAMKAPASDRERLFDEAHAWASSVSKPGGLPARIARARKRAK